MEGSGTPLRRAFPFLAIAATILLAFLAGRNAVLMSGESNFGDYEMYWFAAAASENPPGTDVYGAPGETATNRLRQEYLGWTDPSRTDGVDPACYVANSSTPFLFSLVSALSLHDIRRDYFLFQAVSTLLLLLVLHAAFRVWGYPPWSAMAALLLVPCFLPYDSDLMSATPTRLLLGLVAAAAICIAGGSPGRRFAGGALMGTAVMIKPIVILAPAFLFLYRLRRRRFGDLAREGAGFLAAVAGAAAFAAIHFRSPGIWMAWAERLRALPREALPVTYGNFSLTDLLMWVTGRDLSAILPAAAACIVLAAAFVLSGKRDGSEEGADDERREDWLLLSLGCTAFLLVSPRAWVHYYLLSLPLLLALWGMGTGGRRRILFRRGIAILSVAMMSAVPLANLLSTEYREDVVVVIGLAMWGGALLAWLAGARELAGGWGSGKGEGPPDEDPGALHE